jgi:hypothetical protein
MAAFRDRRTVEESALTADTRPFVHHLAAG